MPSDKPPKKKKPRVHSKLDGFEVSVNQFGELQSSMPIERLNEFLNENVEDKKLAEREDYDDMKKARPTIKSENEEDGRGKSKKKKD
jgi:hypothetical protein